ncbi:DUF1593 domain-containing protein [Gilvimarinus sp. SDUM040013]|uniref:DUF1593 domain-containing protein n=1 Tax=Gilvimarinus gilvus TaxID=3058038 RepID=A0ABU4RYR2_9GAMM|nr:nucleoside hydrolase-like domain-containing protein [Gilvimarinus sp. SDUM040013]MDX6848738.1 DUF1593 domain-containing protein [Gilvimarinus sp. SDUM040013]
MFLFNKFAVVALLVVSGFAQGNALTGTVKDESTNIPIVGAKVSLANQGVTVVTNSEGEFTLKYENSDSPSVIQVTERRYWQREIPSSLNDSSPLNVRLQAKKQRLIITTDIGGVDPDDLQSLLHALLLSNEYDLEGIIYGHAWVESSPERGRSRIEKAIDAYGKVYENLTVHSTEYPTPNYLRSIVRAGQAEPRMEGAGKGKDSEGSNLIVTLVENDDPRPVWINAWGGANTIAQAFWKVNATRSKGDLDKFVSKVRVYDILGQDDSGSWIAKTFPNVTYIRNADGVYGWAPEKAWTAEHVQSHGPIGSLYPTSKWATEGDSPAFLHLASRGLNNPNSLTQGGWGGRFGAQKTTGVKLFSWAEKTPEVYAHEQTLKPYALYTNTAEGAAAIKKWQPDIDNSLAVRMDWSVTPNWTDANHFPVAILEGDKTRQILERSVTAGEEIILSADGSSDPDNDSLVFSWLYYNKASTYDGAVDLQGHTTPAVKIKVPEDSFGKTIHIILAVRDSGAPTLAAYRRMILKVKNPSPP